MNHDIKTEIHTMHAMTLSRQDVIDLLKRKYGVPPDATVSITVPGGGDWAHVTLDLDDAGGLKVMWMHTEKHDGPIREG